MISYKEDIATPASHVLSFSTTLSIPCRFCIRFRSDKVYLPLLYRTTANGYLQRCSANRENKNLYGSISPSCKTPSLNTRSYLLQRIIISHNSVSLKTIHC